MSTEIVNPLDIEQLINQDDVTAVVAEVQRLKRERDEAVEKLTKRIEKAHAKHKELTTERAELSKPYEQGIKLGEKLLSVFATNLERVNSLVRAQAGADIRRERLEDPDIQQYIEDIRATEGCVAADLFEAEVKHMELPANLPVYEETFDFGPGQTRKSYSFEVVDKDAIPEEYYVLDEAKIKKVVAAGASIPGVRSSVTLKRIVKK